MARGCATRRTRTNECWSLSLPVVQYCDIHTAAKGRRGQMHGRAAPTSKGSLSLSLSPAGKATPTRIVDSSPCVEYVLRWLGFGRMRTTVVVVIIMGDVVVVVVVDCDTRIHADVRPS